MAVGTKSEVGVDQTPDPIDHWLAGVMWSWPLVTLWPGVRGPIALVATRAGGGVISSHSLGQGACFYRQKIHTLTNEGALNGWLFH